MNLLICTTVLMHYLITYISISCPARIRVMRQPFKLSICHFFLFFVVATIIDTYFENIYTYLNYLYLFWKYIFIYTSLRMLFELFFIHLPPIQGLIIIPC